MTDPDKIPDEDWDSDAEEAGGGHWQKGEWIPIRKKKNKWWLRDRDKDKDKNKGGKDGEKEVEGTGTGTGTGTIENVTPMKVHVLEDKGTNKGSKKIRTSTGTQGAAESKDSNICIISDSNSDGNGNGHIIHLGTPPPSSALRPHTADEPGLSETSQQNLGPEIGLDDKAYQATLTDNASAHFVRTMLVLLKAADQLALNRLEITDMKRRTVHAGQKKEEARMVHQECSIRYSGSVSKRLTTEKILTDMMKYARFTMGRAKGFREKLRVFRLLNKVTLSGHTAISWAASLGNYEALDELLSKGGTPGYNSHMLHLSATFIQQSYRLYRFITEAKREGEKDLAEAQKKAMKKKEAAQAWRPGGGGGDDDDFDDDDSTAISGSVRSGSKGGQSKALASVAGEDAKTDIAVAGNGEFAQLNNSMVIEKMYKLKETRKSVLHKIRYFRNKMRFPIPEAAYRGNWQVSLRLSLRLSLSLILILRFKGLFLYNIGILCNVECCIRQLWCSSVILYNTTSIAHNHHIDLPSF